MERTPPTVGGQQPTLELPPSANDPSKFLNVFTDLPEDQFSLTAVFLKNNPQVSDSGLANLARISGLVELILDGAKVTDAGLVHLKQLKNLTFLFLAHTRVSDDGILHLKDLKSLASVDRTKTLVTDASIDALVACEKLRSASLRGTKVTELGAKRLAAKPSGCKVEWDGGMIEP